MRKVFVVGIGAGNPDYVTVQAINALNEVDVFLIITKDGVERGETDPPPSPPDRAYLPALR
jgi:precorrin-6A synthase